MRIPLPLPILRQISDVGPNLIGTVAIQIFGVFTAVIVARIYSPAGRGEIAAAVSWLLLLSVIADIGISQAVPYYAARASVGTARSAQLACLTATIAFTPILLFLPKLVGFNLSVAAYTYAVGGVFFSLSINYVGCVFQGQGRSAASTLVRIYGALPYLFAVVLVALNNDSPDSLLLHTLAFSAFLWLLLMLWAFRSGNMAGPASIALARKMSAFGLRTYAGNLAWIGSQRIPPLVIGALAGNAALGLFAVAQSLAIAPFIVASSFALVVHRRVASASAEGRAKIVRATLVNSILATCAAAAVMLPVVSIGVELAFGSEYAEATIPAAILTIASAFFGVNFVLTALLRALERPALPSWAELIGLLVNITAGAMAAATWGLMGSSIVILGSAAIVCFTLLLMIRRHIHGTTPGTSRSGTIVSQNKRRKGNEDEDLCIDSSV